METNPGSPGGSSGPPTPGAEGQHSPPSPWPAGCVSPTSVLTMARAAPAHTPAKHTHEHARPRTRLPPRSASYLPRRRGSGRTPGCRRGAGTGSEDGTGAATSGSGCSSAGAGLGRGLELGLPGCRPPGPAPRPPPIWGQRRGLQWGRRPGWLRMRTGPALWGKHTGKRLQGSP